MVSRPPKTERGFDWIGFWTRQRQINAEEAALAEWREYFQGRGK